MTLLILIILWMALPFWPAISELRKPTDAKPLNVFQGNAADALEPFRQANGEAIFEIDLDSPAPWVEKWDGQALVRARGAVTLTQVPEQVTHVNANDLHVSATTTAKLSALHSVTLDASSAVQFVQAPTIFAGKLLGINKQSLIKPGLSIGRVEDAQWQELQGWWHATGAAHIAEGRFIKGDVLARSLGVAANAVVDGSIHVDGTVRIEDGAVIKGSVIARSVEIGPNAHVHGCVVADQSVTIKANAIVGTLQAPSSVVATDLTLESGAVIHGGISAHRAVSIV